MSLDLLRPPTHPRSSGYNVTVTDLFAGAGGSSTGASLIPGVKIRYAANHWKLAIAVHNANHPDTDHAAVDLHKEDPRFFARTDILWASPECTKWSQASGKQRPAIEEGLFEDPLSDEAASRSRLLMFDVLRFMEHHRYSYAIIENVVDIAVSTKYANAWLVWRQKLTALGYKFRVVSLNSMHAQAHGAPAPQSRDRVYIVCWLDGQREPDIDRILRPKAWCEKCEQTVEANQAWKNGSTVGKYRQQYVYVHGACGTKVEPGYLPAAAAIDWSIQGERIGDRKKALTEKTLARVAAGIARYWSPLAVPVEGRDGKEATSLDLPMRTQTTRAETALAYNPFILDRRGEYRVRELHDPLSTITANDTTKALLSQGRLPFVAELRGGGSDARAISDPAATFTASGNHHALVTPAGGTWNDAAFSSQQTLPTLTTRDAYALVAPYYPSGSGLTAKPASEPLGALTTVDRYALVHRNNGGGAEMTTPAHEYMRTLTTAGHQSLIQAGPRGGRPPVTPADLAAARAMVEDCYFRMFQPHEVAAGMAFPDTYDWHPDKTKKVSNRDLVKMAGNAVTPPAARDLMAVVVEALTGETPEFGLAA